MKNIGVILKKGTPHKEKSSIFSSYRPERKKKRQKKFKVKIIS